MRTTTYAYIPLKSKTHLKTRHAHRPYLMHFLPSFRTNSLQAHQQQHSQQQQQQVIYDEYGNPVLTSSAHSTLTRHQINQIVPMLQSRQPQGIEGIIDMCELATEFGNTFLK